MTPSLVAFTVYTLLGNALGHRFRTKRDARRLNAGFGITLLAVAAWMVFH